MQRVIVHIDQLVLKGFRHEDRHAFAAGLQEQLSKQLAMPGITPHLAELNGLPRLQIGNISMLPELNQQQVGVEVARGIGREIISSHGKRA